MLRGASFSGRGGNFRKRRHGYSGKKIKARPTEIALTPAIEVRLVVTVLTPARR